MIRRILLGLNGTPAADSVLPTIAALTKRLGAELTILYAVDRHAAVTPQPSQGAVRLGMDHEEASGREYLLRVEHQLRDAGVPVHSHLVAGDPASALVASAAQLGTDAIALATHGLSGFHHLARRCVAEEVLDSSPLPVLLLPASDQAPAAPVISEIVAPLDGSASDPIVVSLAEGLAQALDVPLVLLRAVERDLLHHSEGPDAAEDERALLTALRTGIEAYLEQVATELRHHEDLVEASRRDAERYLEQIAAPLRTSGLTVRIVTPVGQPEHAVEDYSASHPNCLVVMAARDHSSVSLPSGWRSVHDDLERLNVPVFVVRRTAAAA